MGIREEFKNPGKDYRGAPFWAWNDDLDDAELVRQIRVLKDGGMGGFFMHSRTGLITKYMSNEWMRKIRVCAQASAKLGMNAWLYDEDRWPSGFAGGMVPRKGKQYWSKHLSCKEIKVKTKKDMPKKSAETLGVFMCDRIEDNKPVNLVNMTGKKLSFKEARGKVILHFEMKYEERIPWFNNNPYVDLLSKKVVDDFIESTYEPYKKRFKPYFMRCIPGVFTDEPNFYPFAWTGELPAFFKKEKGYNLLEYLPGLFYKTARYAKTRYDYANIITLMFVNNFSKNIYDWCEKYQIAFTGHYNAEDTLTYQRWSIGSAMPHYKYQQVPGIDHLRNDINHVMTVKQVSSVAHQFGGRRVLSEAFGASGWEMTLEDMKWGADWQYALGVNLICQHLCLYSLRGDRKRDFPPSIFYQQPWWGHHWVLGDYHARVCYMMTRGTYQANVLVLHPIGSAWAVYNDKKYSEEDFNSVEKLSADFEDVSRWLMELKVHYDYGDEIIIREHGEITDGKFRIGTCAYDTVIIPPSITWDAYTVKLIKQFLATGGKTIVVKPVPVMIGGEMSREIMSLFSSKDVLIIENSRKELEKAVKKTIPMDVEVVDKKGENIGDVYCQYRKTEDMDIYFFANTSKEKEYDATIRIKGNGCVEEWDLVTGDTKQVPATQKDGYSFIETKFYPGGSLLYVINDDEPAECKKTAEKNKVSVIKLNDDWFLERDTINSKTIDFCRYRIDNGKWSKPMYVLDVQGKALDLSEKKKFSITLKYEFCIEDRSKIESNIFLAVETPEKYEIKVNGKPLKYSEEGYWLDTAFKLVTVNSFLKEDLNKVELKTVFKKPLKKDTFIYEKGGTQIESIYVLGEFSVKSRGDRDFAIAPDKIMTYSAGSDLTKRGYPFFAGRLCFYKRFKLKKQNGKRVYFEIDNFDANAIDVWVNMECMGRILWKPYRVDITDRVLDGENRIRLAVVNSCRNLLGPHHYAKKKMEWVGPDEFRHTNLWTDKYMLVPLGIGRARIIVSDEELC